jgi:hypothetical protein
MAEVAAEVTGCGASSAQELCLVAECALDSVRRADTAARMVAEQWLGACATPATAADRWISQGGASYAAALLAEARSGPDGYHAAMERLHRESFPGTVRGAGAESAEAPSDSTAALKGAWVFHTLRWVLSNQRSDQPGLFAEILRGFAQSPAFRLGNVTTEEFVRHWEEAAALDLRWFFGPAVFGTGRPLLAYDWSAGGSGGEVQLHLEQLQPDPLYPAGEPYPLSPSFFPAFWEIQLEGGPGVVTTRVVRQTTRVQDFTVVSPHPVSAIRVDPDHWALRELKPYAPSSGSGIVRLQPNPAAGSILVIYRVGAQGQGPVEADREFTLDLFDALGRRVRRLVHGAIPAGVHAATWDGTTDSGARCAAGAYWARASDGRTTRARRLVLYRP